MSKVSEIKEIVCESIGIDESEFLQRKGRTHVKFAHYIFSHFAYKEVPNKELIKTELGAPHVNKVSEYLRKHNEFLTDTEYRKLTNKIEQRINDTHNN